MSIRRDMPVLARHEGLWEGVYIYVDADGHEVDRHASRLSCHFPEDAESADYFQVNEYTWADGRRERFEFPARYSDNRICWDTDRITGAAWEIDENSIVLTWRRKDIEGASLYEMIQISQDGNQRARTWHWFENGVLLKRVLIKEERIQ